MICIGLLSMQEEWEALRTKCGIWRVGQLGMYAYQGFPERERQDRWVSQKHTYRTHLINPRRLVTQDTEMQELFPQALQPPMQELWGCFQRPPLRKMLERVCPRKQRSMKVKETSQTSTQKRERNLKQGKKFRDLPLDLQPG